MKKNILKIVNSRWAAWFVVGIIICIQLANITNIIADQKKGYHSDEVFSYGLSNSFYQPFINGNYYQVGDAYRFENLNEWLDGSALRNYVTVQNGERFRYDSVWYNQELDRHPPFYYAVMHTISSLFPDTFTPVFGYAVNFVCFAVMQIYIYKLSRILLKSRWLSVLICFGWGFCTASLNIVIFIRMYCMLAMFTIIFFYLHARLAEKILKMPKMQKSEKSEKDDSEEKTVNKNSEGITKRDIIGLVAVTLLGALTQHIFLILAFLTAVLFCLWLLFEKRVKVFLQYGFSLLGGALLSIAVFPATIPHFFGEGENAEGGFELIINQINLSWKYFATSCFSLRITVIITFLIYVLTAIVIASVFSVPFIYLFRDKIKPKEKFSFIKTNIKNYFSSLPKRIKGITWKSFVSKLRSFNPMTFIIFMVYASVMIIISCTINFMMSKPADRYFFIVFPAGFVAAVSMVYFLFSKVPFKKQLSAVLLVIVGINIIMNSSCTYLYNSRGTLENISDITAGNSVIVVEETRTDDWLVNTLPPEMYDVGKIFVTNVEEIENYTDNLNTLESSGKLYLMICESVVYDEETAQVDEEKLNQQLSFYKSTDIINNIEYLGTYEIFTYIYRIYECK